MKSYRVVISLAAKEDLKRCIRYLKNVKNSVQAAQNVMDDYRQTSIILSDVADSIKDPDSIILKSRGLKRINFQKHRYFMLFKVEDNKVIITNIFHELEDYENKLH